MHYILWFEKNNKYTPVPHPKIIKPKKKIVFDRNFS